MFIQSLPFVGGLNIEHKTRASRIERKEGWNKRMLVGVLKNYSWSAVVAGAEDIEGHSSESHSSEGHLRLDI